VNKVEWLNSKVNNPEETKDYYFLYDDFCTQFQSEVTMESFKRYCRDAYRDLKRDTGENTVSDKEVILDKLNETENKLELTLKSYKIQDVETAAQIAGIDLSQWKCVRKTVRASQNNNTPWFIVEGKFEPITTSEMTVEELLENVQQMLESHTTVAPQINPPKIDKKENVALVNFYDHHIGKRIHADATGNGSEWTVDLAKKSMLEATDYFIDKLQHDTGKIVFILGNDLLNIDNPQGTTTKGTPQNNDMDYRHLILESNELLTSVLEKFLHYFEVEVIVVPGNHDNNLAFITGEVIRHYFMKTPHISVDNSLAPIKYWQFGENAIGFTHGSEQIKKKYVLPMLMLQQKPEFAVCKYKEFHTGHLHQTKKTQLTEVGEQYGMIMRTLPTLSPTCEWASTKGFQGIQATECIVYHKEKGPITTYRYSG
jgi:urease accessory protein UreE